MVKGKEKYNFRDTLRVQNETTCNSETLEINEKFYLACLQENRFCIISLLGSWLGDGIMGLFIN